MFSRVDCVGSRLPDSVPSELLLGASGLSDLMCKPGSSGVRAEERMRGRFLYMGGVPKPYLLNVPNPVPDVVEGLLVGDVIDQHDALISRDRDTRSGQAASPLRGRAQQGVQQGP